MFFSIIRSISLLTVFVAVSAQAQTRALIPDDYPSTSSGAYSILLNREINGDLETSNDEDWFKFTLDTADGIQFFGNSNEGSVSTDGGIGLFLYTEAEILNDSTPEYIAYIWNTKYEGEESLLINLEAGTYFIKAYKYIGDGITGYVFRVLSAENNGSWSPDPQTVQYCKDKPSACGINSGKPIIIPMF